MTMLNVKFVQYIFLNRKTECYKLNQFKPKPERSIIGDCESCQDEISALTTRVNRVDFARVRLM